MDNKCEVSIVLATYNGSKYIVDQLRSLKDQTKKPDEIIIYDDGSFDNTVDVAENFLKKYNLNYKIKKHIINKGVKETFKNGLVEASGEYVFFCDQDDFWYKEKIEEFLKVFKDNNKATVVLSDADITDEHLIKNGKTLWENLHFKPNKNNIIDEMFRRNVFTGMSMAVKKKWVDTLPVYSSYMLHDEYLGWCSALEGTCMFLQKSLAAYRQHGNNTVGVASYTQFHNIKQFKRKVKESDENTLKKYCDLQRLTRNKDILLKISDGMGFYNSRMSYFDLDRFSSIYNFIRNIVDGKYFKYCSDTDHALLKDIAVILL